MKRAAGNCKQSQPADEETRTKFRHESLLQDYLLRQKEFVSKKQMIQAAKQKRDILLAEIRFLRRRYSHLLKIKSAETEPEVRHQNSDVQPKKLAKKKKDANEAVVNKPSRASPEGGGVEHIVSEPVRVEKKRKNRVVNGRKVGKKKIAVQDQVSLNV
ncbi:uncharacterized protein LOC103949734 [Pyrus x bretschneideri]|uniref:uncharacterized protein LOC103949734 n=1 Tax=Pyrus x bretschneideri TaxID=225117 RepID=UPI002030A2E3|nr:uncharacterized protein LOC103949734 [Pyrus x bretschneideri]XP_048444394.1 uncharacterized protein LOC103949734 [Pyrus x bretschneideri]